MTQHFHINHSCFHNIRYCATCDAAYCTLCSRQWGGRHPYSYVPVFGSTMGGSQLTSAIGGLANSSNASPSTTFTAHTHSE